MPKRRSSISSLQAEVVREGPFATPYDDGHEEQVAFVDHPGPEGLGGQVRSAHGEIRPAVALSSWTAPGSKCRSSRVLALWTVARQSSVLLGAGEPDD